VKLQCQYEEAIIVDLVLATILSSSKEGRREEQEEEQETDNNEGLVNQTPYHLSYLNMKT
jgi:hypothetical protein